MIDNNFNAFSELIKYSKSQLKRINIQREEKYKQISESLFAEYPDKEENENISKD